MPGEDNFPLSVVVTVKDLEKINLQGNQLLTELADRFGTFKRNFYASPIEIVMNAVKNKTEGKCLSYSVRPGEKTWILHNSKHMLYLAKQNTMTIYYGISFLEKAEQQVVKILLTVKSGDNEGTDGSQEASKQFTNRCDQHI